jgi:hypothetical protein
MHNVPRYLPNLCRSLGFMVLCCLAATRWCCPLQPLHYSVMSAAMQRLTVVRCRAALIAVLMLVASHSVWCFAALAVFLLQACVACFCVVRPCARLVWGPVHCWSPAFPLLPVPAPVCCFRLSSVLPLVELCRSRCLKVCNPSNGYWLRLPDQQFALLTAGSSCMHCSGLAPGCVLAALAFSCQLLQQPQPCLPTIYIVMAKAVLMCNGLVHCG